MGRLKKQGILDSQEKYERNALPNNFIIYDAGWPHPAL